MTRDLTRAAASALPPVLRPPLALVVVGLLESRIPARLAWAAADGRPAVVPTWFHWTGTRLEVATFAGAAKLRDLADGDTVAVTIDTDEFPYRALKVRGVIALRPGTGLAPSYEAAAERYLGPSTAARWLRSLEGRDQTVVAITPTWAAVSDLADSPFFALESREGR